MKAKPIIIIVITLIIGFVLGMLTSAQIRYHRLKPVRVFFSEERFRNGFYEVIQPDEKQKSTIDQLLSKFAVVNSDIQNDFRKKLDSTMKDFWKELEPGLTREQISRLKEMDQRRMDMVRGNRRNKYDSSNFRDNRRMQMPFDRRPPYHGRDSLKMRDYRDSNRLKNNIEKVVK
ncbi:MAG: hypothetical protein C0408_03550 [Odoribacter sp.]|nr:hypothetical protein [Odoribacter sp.]